MADQVNRILCVDDEPILTEVLGLVVTELDLPFELLVAGEPEDVRRIIDEGAVAMVMLDVNMPRVNGLELAAEITQQHPDTPVLVYSADGEVHRDAAFKAGARAYLCTPFDLDELLAILRDSLPQSDRTVAS